MRLLSFAFVCLAAACASAPAPLDTAAIEHALATLTTRPELAGGRIGVHVLAAPGGALVASHAADRGFATASNLKLLSAAIGLATLGPEQRFGTEVHVHGSVEAGTLRGELRLRGGGDPSFGTKAQFDELAALLRARGIERLVGRVVADDGWLGSEHRGLGWQWDYLDEDYAAPFGALCCRGNTIAVQVAIDGGAAKVTCSPAVGPAAAVAVDVLPAGSKAELSVRRPLGRDRIEVAGALPLDAKPRTVRIAVHDPAAFTAAVTIAELRARGFEIDELQDVVAVGAPELLTTFVSAPLGDLVQPLLCFSDNLFAEQVWRTAARVATGDGSTASSAAHGRSVLTALGVDAQGLVQADGSGLSRRNLVQPRQLAGVLSAAWQAPWREPFVAALPLAGATGTLKNRFREGPAHQHVRAKTGYIARVVCLSGYVLRPNPLAEPLVFSVMLNDFTCSDDEAKAAVDAFVQALAKAAGW